MVSFIPKKKSARPTFSLCHTTARLPDGWRAAAQAWNDAADNPGDIEHVLVTDDPDFVPYPDSQPIFADTKIGVNRGRKCAVDGWNKSAELSTGRFLITLADDWFPCPHWDTEFLKMIPDLDGEYVLEVDTGGNHGLLTFSLLTRKYYQRYGYLFWPQYLGMYADNEFTIVARRDGVVIDARHLYCEHRHPLYGHGQMDETHKHQHRPEAFEVGEEIYRRRLVHLGFAKEYIPARKFLIAMCLPFEWVETAWVANMLKLSHYIASESNLVPIPGYSSNPHMTRMGMTQQVLAIEPLPDMVLWIDDDNLVSALNFARLFSILKQYPDIDGATGWCYRGHESENLMTSCGIFEDGKRRFYTPEELSSGPEIKRVDFTGFPCFLMRGSALKKIGWQAFKPILDDSFPFGFRPEDIAFCDVAREAGLKFVVDRLTEVPHRKVQDLRPYPKTVEESSAVA